MEIFAYIMMVISWFGAIGCGILCIAGVILPFDPELRDEDDMDGKTAFKLFLIAIESIIYLSVYYKYIT